MHNNDVQRERAWGNGAPSAAQMGAEVPWQRRHCLKICPACGCTCSSLI